MRKLNELLFACKYNAILESLLSKFKQLSTAKDNCFKFDFQFGTVLPLNMPKFTQNSTLSAPKTYEY